MTKALISYPAYTNYVRLFVKNRVNIGDSKPRIVSGQLNKFRLMSHIIWKNTEHAPFPREYQKSYLFLLLEFWTAFAYWLETGHPSNIQPQAFICSENISHNTIAGQMQNASTLSLHITYLSYLKILQYQLKRH